MKNLFPKSLILAWILSISSSYALSPQGFTFQGKLFDSTGTVTLTEPVVFRFQILNPSADCLLYEETQNFDTSFTDGAFAVTVGSLTGAPKRTVGIDPGLSMATVFKNDTATQTRAVDPSCPAGYTPTSGDVRLLRVIVTPSSTGVPETLTPDQEINSVPQSLVAQTLQGLAPDSFVNLDSTYITSGNLDLMYGRDGSLHDASTLHHHDGRYLAVSGVTGYNTTAPSGVGTAANFANTMMSVTSTVDTQVGLAVRSNSATQSADVLQVQNDSGTAVAGISQTGALTTSDTLRVNKHGGNIYLIGNGTKEIYTGEATNSWGIGIRQITGAGDNSNELFSRSASLNIVPNAGSHLRVNLSTTGDFMVNSNDLYVDTSTGNVGINTTNPSTAFEVEGTTQIFANDNLNGAIAFPLVIGHKMSASNAGNFHGTGLIFQGESSTGTQRDLARIGSYWSDSTDATRTSDLMFGTVNSGVHTEKMRIRGSGNVGIGDTNPMHLLSLEGTRPVAAFRDTGSSARGYFGQFGTNALHQTFNLTHDGTNWNRDDVTWGGGVMLWVGGALTFRNTPAGANPAAMTERFKIMDNGNVGIGAANPGYLLQVGELGDGTEARANQWNALSDERLKKDFKEIPEALKKILSLNGYFYHWKESVDKSRKMGLKAQEVQKVFPEVVSEGDDGYLSLSYDHMIAPVINAIHELHEENQQLKKQNRNIASENKKMKNELSEMKEVLCLKDPTFSFCKDRK